MKQTPGTAHGHVLSLARAVTRAVVDGGGVAPDLSMPGCESREQTVRIVAEDLRFTPAEVHVSSEYPIRLLVVNERREQQEFMTVLLAHQIGMSLGPSSSLPVPPNQKAEALVRTISGVDVFYCAMRGHAGMSGTIIVE